MPQIILKFKLPKEQYEAELASRAPDLSFALIEIYNMLRNEVKYAEHTKEADKAWEEAFTNFNAIITENNVDRLIFK